MTDFWTTLLQLFVTRYNIPPSAFWKLSAREAEVLIGGLFRASRTEAPEREALLQMIERFPDTPGNIHKGKPR